MKVRLIDQKFIFLFMGIYYILFSRQRINCVKKIITKCTFHHHLKKLLGNTPAMCVLTVFEQNNSVLIHVYSSALCDEWFFLVCCSRPDALGTFLTLHYSIGCEPGLFVQSNTVS